MRVAEDVIGFCYGLKAGVGEVGGEEATVGGIRVVGADKIIVWSGSNDVSHQKSIDSENELKKAERWRSSLTSASSRRRSIVHVAQYLTKQSTHI